MFIRASSWETLLLLLLSIKNSLVIVRGYGEDLPSHYPCYAIHKRFGPYITQTTENFANSQQKAQRDACHHYNHGPVCCTDQTMSSYALSLSTDIRESFETELTHLTRIFSIAKRQTDVWLKEYIKEARRLTVSSLETLFGTEEYRRNVHQSVSILFDTLDDNHSSVDHVSKATVDLLRQLIVSLYQRFMVYDSHLSIDEKLQRCLVNKAFDMEALSSQRELLYILTSGSALVQLFRTWLIYIDADFKRLQSTTTSQSHHCLQHYARATLCPVCHSRASTRIDTSLDLDELLCEKDCRNVLQTCVNQSSNPFVSFASIAKGYATIMRESEQAVVELQLVERLSKLHIYFYDMIVNVTNSQRIYTQLQTACANPNAKPFSPILSLPPITIERPVSVGRWNRTLHHLFLQLQSSMENLSTKFTKESVREVCSQPHVASTSPQCTQIDLTQWTRVFIPSVKMINIEEDNELTRNQLDDLKRKFVPIQEIIVSLRPKKIHRLMEHLPDFESYTDELTIHNPHPDETHSSSLIETDEPGNQGSLSERLYREFDEHTTRIFDRTTVITTESPEQTKTTSNCQSITYSITLSLIVLIFEQIH